MRTAKVIAIIAVVLMVVGLVLGTGCAGKIGPQGPKGDTGPQGPSGGLAWGTPVSYGPYTDSIYSDAGFTQQISNLQPGDRVSFDFTSPNNCHMFAWVKDPYDNIVYIDNLCEYEKYWANWFAVKENYTLFCSDCSQTPASSGQGVFIAAASGTYKIDYVSSIWVVNGMPVPTVLTTSYTVYPVK